MFYGNEVTKKILPLLDKETTQSILVGDLLGNDQQFIFEILRDFLELSRPFEYIHSTDLYCVYINILSRRMLRTVHEGLRELDPYIGYLPSTYSTPAKAYLSTTSLVNSCIKYRSKIILAHEDDRSNTENININHPAYGILDYKIISLQSIYFDNFLSYKIESSFSHRHQIDLHYSLNSISNNVLPIDQLNIILEERKYEYLLKAKGGEIRKSWNKKSR